MNRMYCKQYYDGIYLPSDKKKLIIDKVLSFYSDKSEHDILKRFFKRAEEIGNNNRFYKIIDNSLAWSQTEEGWLFWYKAQLVLIMAYLYYAPNDHDALDYSKSLFDNYQFVERKKLEKTAFFINASKIVRRLTDNTDFDELPIKLKKMNKIKSKKQKETML